MRKRRGYRWIKAHRRIGRRVRGHWRKIKKLQRIKAIAVVNFSYHDENYSIIIIAVMNKNRVSTKKQQIEVRDQLVKKALEKLEKNPGLWKLYRKSKEKHRPALQVKRFRGRRGRKKEYRKKYLLQNYKEEREIELAD